MVDAGKDTHTGRMRQRGVLCKVQILARGFTQRVRIVVNTMDFDSINAGSTPAPSAK